MVNTAMPVSVKVYFKKGSAMEIRRFNFRPDDPRGKTGIYANLLERIRALYSGLNIQDFNLCWKDDDGDYVVFSSDDELKVALNSVTDNTLRIYLKVSEQSPGPSGVQLNNSTHHESRPLVAHGRISMPDAKEFNAATTFSGLNQPDSSSGMRSHQWSRSRESLVTGERQTVPYHSHPHHPRDTTPVRLMTVHETEHHDVEILQDGGTNCNNIGGSGAAAASNCLSPPLCSECGGEGRGVWYRCTVCSNYYLCSDCENRGLHDYHIMVRIRPTSSTSTNFTAATTSGHHRPPPHPQLVGRTVNSCKPQPHEAQPFVVNVVHTEQIGQPEPIPEPEQLQKSSGYFSAADANLVTQVLILSTDQATSMDGNAETAETGVDAVLVATFPDSPDAFVAATTTDDFNSPRFYLFVACVAVLCAVLTSIKLFHNCWFPPLD